MRLGEQRLERGAALSCGSSMQARAADGEQVEGDERRRRRDRQLGDPRRRRVQALLQGVEVEAGGAGDDDLAVDDRAVGSRASEGVAQLGEVAVERAQVAALDRDLAGASDERRWRESRPTSARTGSRPRPAARRPPWRASARSAPAGRRRRRDRRRRGGRLRSRCRRRRSSSGSPCRRSSLSCRRGSSRSLSRRRRFSGVAATGQRPCHHRPRHGPDPSIDPSTRRSATTWLGRGLLFVAIVFLLEHARPLLLPVTIAIVFTFVLAAPVRALQRARRPRVHRRGARHRRRARRRRRCC